MANVVDYKAKRASDIAGSTTAALAFKQVDNSTLPVILYVPTGTKAFRVRAGGTATGGTTTNFTPAIYKGTSATAGSDTLLGGHAATAYNTASGGWHLEVKCQLDTVNSKIHGSKCGWVGTTPTVLADTIIADLTTITTLDLMPLVVFGTFSASDAGNTATLDYFSLEVLEQKK